MSGRPARSAPARGGVPSAITLSRLIGGFVRHHWPAYAASGAMLGGIALLGIWLPRQVGQMVDGLVARQLRV